MINLLLDYPDKIGDVNYISELDMTPLHYACLYNMPEIANKIIMENSAINAKEKRMEILHYICYVRVQI